MKCPQAFTTGCILLTVAALAVTPGCTRESGGAGGGGRGGGEPTEEARSALGTTCVTVRRGVAGDVADAFLSGDSPGWATGGESSMYTGKSGGGNLNRSVIRFDLSLLPPGATVVSATAKLPFGWTASDDVVQVHRVLTPWSEATVSESNFGAPGNYDPVPAASFTTGGGLERTFDLTTLAAGWVDGSVPNHGIMLIEAPVDGHLIWTSESGAAAQRPGLEVCYEACAGACPPDLCAGIVCSAQDACHNAGACDPATGLCSNPLAANGTACDDGDACTAADTCAAGACVGGSPTPCAPSDTCHLAGVCDPATGLCSDPPAANGTACDDGNPCTMGDACQSGTCAGAGPATCDCIDIRRGTLGDIHDTILSGDFPASPGGSDASLYTGLSGGGNEHRTLVSMDTGGALPPGSTLLSATLHMGVSWNTDDTVISVHGVTQPWSEATTTSDSFGPNGVDPAATASFHAGGFGFKQADITSLAAGWHTGALANHGVMLREAPVSGHTFWSSEAAPALRPYVTVCYGTLCQGVVCAPSDACHAAGTCDPATGLCSDPILDADADGLGDCSDPCPTDAGNDPDEDGVCAGADNCPNVPNPAQDDTNGDGVGDACNGPAGAAIAVGGFHTCAIRNGGEVFCWGQNAYGQLGNGSLTNAMSPVQVTGLSDAVGISAGWDHTCALRSTGEVVCWGHNGFGGLGDGSTTNSTTPVPVVGLSDAKSIGAGFYHTCAVRATGEVVCWGYNGTGALGDGSKVNSVTPVQVSGLSDATGVAGGVLHTCATRATGGVACWGYNDLGQLGDGSTATSTVPVQVSGLSSAVQVSAGAYHTCAVRAAGDLVCWGYNTLGALGNGSTANSPVPVQVSGLSDAVAVSGGLYHTCALRATDEVACWGSGQNGQLGDGRATSTTTPVIVQDLWYAAAVGASSDHSCALRATGEVLCWGYGIYGALGDGSAQSTTIPTTALDGLDPAECPSPQAGIDLPDPAFVDSNGDGIDGDLTAAYFVSPLGSDANPGTQAAPFLTIHHAVRQAAAHPCHFQVLIAAGTYHETVHVPSGVSLWGQYDPVTWARSASNTTSILSPTTEGLVVTEYSSEGWIEGLQVTASAAQIAGRSSRAMLLRDVTADLHVDGNKLIAGDGAPGAAGINSGSYGCCGGPGGEGGQFLGPGLPGGTGCGGTAGGPGGGGFGGWGAPGGNGGAGAPGVPPPGQAQGTMFGTQWHALEGGVGQSGACGGGGGGGASNLCCIGLYLCAPMVGGAGGKGGQGGPPGRGGGGAGGSFGIVAIDAPGAIVTNNTLVTGDGGQGGTGGPGAGGFSGAGGVGGMPCFAGSGGSGGPGGTGGPGGSGSGGGGGMSVGILVKTGNLVVAGNTFTLGSAGPGGAGESTGTDGIQADVFGP